MVVGESLETLALAGSEAAHSGVDMDAWLAVSGVRVAPQAVRQFFLRLSSTCARESRLEVCRTLHQPSPALPKHFLVRPVVVAPSQRGVGSAIPVRAASRCAGNFFPRRSALRSIPAHAALLRK